jgi:hypothetical protein
VPEFVHQPPVEIAIRLKALGYRALEFFPVSPMQEYLHGGPNELASVDG